ncbi:hypothetical protein [Laceyella tengchongensis]|uniref:hypothetical protein n=1 Tax=Laceyella tengchongensis TaxID=574699 RepID=UPI0012B9FADE|nr:hypothetical protein [Laceyella tengchongensis]
MSFNKVLWKGKDFTIEYLKTSISINSFVGCYLGCEYCILYSLEFPSKPLKIMDEEDAVMQLLAHKYFTFGLTPISINNKSDPLLKEVKDSTFKIMKVLERERVTNPIYLISKLELTDEDIDFLDSLKLNVYVFYSFSGLGNHLEKVSTRYQEYRIKKLSHARNIKKIHYWRPLIVGENDDETTIRHMLEVVSSVFDVSIVSGLRVNEKVKKAFDRLNISVPFNNYTIKHKYVEKEVFERVRQIRDEICPDYPLFRHTSCLTSYWAGTPDFNHHDRKKINCTIFNCPNQSVCATRKKPSTDLIDKLLSRIGKENEYEIREDHVMFKGVMSQEDLSFLNLNMGFKALSEKKAPTASESVIEVE